MTPLSLALKFGTATGDRVNCVSNAQVDNLSQATILAWLRPDTTATVVRYLASKWSTTGTKGWQFNNVSANGTQLRLFRHRATTDQQVSTPTGFLTVGQWRFVAGQFDTAGSPKMFGGGLNDPAVDVSTSVNNGAGTQVDDSANDLMIGNSTDAVSAFNGLVKRVRVYNRLLTPAEVVEEQWRMLDGDDGYGSFVLPGCVFDAALGETGTALQIDRSGFGNHGVVTGATPAWGPPGRTVALPRRTGQDQAGGNTSYTGSLTGSVTLSATLTKAVARPTTGTATPAGVLTKADAKGLTGTGTPTGALTKADAKGLTGTSTPAGASTKATAKPLTGTATPSGGLTKQTGQGKTVTGTVTPSGAVTKAAAKGPTGAATLTGSCTRGGAKPLTGRALLARRPLAGYYPFDGSAADASGAGRHLSPAGSYGAGQFGSAVATADATRTPQGGVPGALAGTPASLTAWLSLTSGWDASDFGSYREVGFLDGALLLRLTAGTQADGSDSTIEAVAGGAVVYTLTGVTPDAWYAAALAWSGSVVRVWLNGAGVPTSAPGSAGNFGTSAFGTRMTAGPGLSVAQAMADDLAVYPSALTAADVAFLWNGGVGRTADSAEGVLTKAAAKALAGTATPSGNLSKLKTFGQALAGAVTLAGAATRAVARGIAATLGLSGALSRLFTPAGGAPPADPGGVFRRAEAGRVFARTAAPRVFARAEVGRVFRRPGHQ